MLIKTSKRSLYYKSNILQGMILKTIYSLQLVNYYKDICTRIIKKFKLFTLYLQIKEYVFFYYKFHHFQSWINKTDFQARNEPSMKVLRKSSAFPKSSGSRDGFRNELFEWYRRFKHAHRRQISSQKIFSVVVEQKIVLAGMMISAVLGSTIRVEAAAASDASDGALSRNRGIEE